MLSDLRNVSIINKDGSLIYKRESKNGHCHASHLEILTGITFEELPKGINLEKIQMKMFKKGMIRVVNECKDSYDMTFVVKPNEKQMNILREFEEMISENGGILRISILNEDKEEFHYISDGNWANTVYNILKYYEE